MLVEFISYHMLHHVSSKICCQKSQIEFLPHSCFHFLIFFFLMKLKSPCFSWCVCAATQITIISNAYTWVAIYIYFISFKKNKKAAEFLKSRILRFKLYLSGFCYYCSEYMFYKFLSIVLGTIIYSFGRGTFWK